MSTSIYYHPTTFVLENGQNLPEFELNYTTHGKIEYDENGLEKNVVWICHALTANSNPAEWWDGLVGEGKFFDPDRHFIICANMPGSCYGSTNALSVNPLTQEPYYHAFPLLTNRDIVRAFDHLRIHLNIKKIFLCIGGSMGGQQALEWAIFCPEVIEHLVLIATNAKHSPWGIAFNESQRMAIACDVTWKENRPDAGLEGMKAARAIALLSYRNYETYRQSQSEESEDHLEQFKASSYQQYQGEKLKKRFHAFAYWTLSKAMDSHNIARQRANLGEVLSKVQSHTLAIGIQSDVLFPVVEQQFIAKHIPGAVYKEIDSFYGHDGFLIENEKISRAISEFIEQTQKTKPINSYKSTIQKLNHHYPIHNEQKS